MALVRFEPAREVDSLQSEVNRVFDAFFGGGSGAPGVPAGCRRWTWSRLTSTWFCAPTCPG